MINQELSEIFRKMGEILQFLNTPGDTFKIRAFINVSLTIAELSESVSVLVKEGRVRTIPGVGEGIAKKIEEYVSTGKVLDFEMMKKLVPEGFFELLDVPFLGPKKIRAVYDSLGVKNTEDLKKAIESGKVAVLPGFGEKSAQKLLEGIGIKAAAKGRRLLGEAYLTVKLILAAMEKCPGISKIVPAGSFRRGEETVGDIDILATGKDAQKIMDFFLKLPFVSTVLGHGDTKVSILTKDGLQVDLRVLLPNQFGSALQYFTGSKMHNVHLRTYAKAKGFKLSEYGFFKEDKLVASKTEEECYKAIGMQYVPPEMRTDTGEIEAALKKQIPKLIELGDIRGDLHSHSLWSDGTSSIEDMARAAIERGYEYIALTDHSPSLTIANGLKLDRLKKKKLEIDKLNAKLPIKILFGTEVDILADGAIDYPDEVLKNFDIVVASIHSRFNQDNTDRILKAMENPYVHIIGHPSGRLIGQRNPYSVNYEKIFKKGAETNTVIEINAQYQRLDLQDSYMREAKRLGCKFSIDSDSHNANSLWIMEIGVKWARRGWVEKGEVVNTLPLQKMLNALK